MIVTTTGIVIDLGADKIDTPYYDDKAKVRVPNIHGYGDAVSNITEPTGSYTEDQDLPWSTIIFPMSNPPEEDSPSEHPILDAKSKYLTEGDVVYVQYDSESPGSTILITGIYSKYTSESQYDGISIGKILGNITSSLLDVLGLSGGVALGTPGSASSSIKNLTPWKSVFGNPFGSHNQYYISANYPNYSSGKHHTGIDLAGSTGTPVYAVGDGKVVKVVNKYRPNSGTSYGNHVIIDHGTHYGQRLFSLYAHLNKASVHVGQEVKGTQLNHPGTKVGERGNTGDSTGPHLHFEMRKGSNKYRNDVNPNDYISF